MADQMIRAQMTLSDGITPGAMRYGTIHIDALIARGCRIVPNPLNNLPPEYDRYIVGQTDRTKRPRIKPSNDATLL